MLILTRSKEQRILINTPSDQIVITVLTAERGQARLGIDAGENVHIIREELRGTPPLRRSKTVTYEPA